MIGLDDVYESYRAVYSGTLNLERCVVVLCRNFQRTPYEKWRCLFNQQEFTTKAGTQLGRLYWGDQQQNGLDWTECADFEQWFLGNGKPGECKEYAFTNAMRSFFVHDNLKHITAAFMVKLCDAEMQSNNDDTVMSKFLGEEIVNLASVVLRGDHEKEWSGTLILPSSLHLWREVLGISYGGGLGKFDNVLLSI